MRGRIDRPANTVWNCNYDGQVRLYTLISALIDFLSHSNSCRASTSPDAVPTSAPAAANRCTTMIVVTFCVACKSFIGVRYGCQDLLPLTNCMQGCAPALAPRLRGRCPFNVPRAVHDRIALPFRAKLIAFYSVACHDDACVRAGVAE